MFVISCRVSFCWISDCAVCQVSLNPVQVMSMGAEEEKAETARLVCAQLLWLWNHCLMIALALLVSLTVWSHSLYCLMLTWGYRVRSAVYMTDWVCDVLVFWMCSEKKRNAQRYIQTVCDCMRFFVISFIVYFPETLIFRSSQYKSFASWDYHLPIVISSLCLWSCCVLWGSKDGISSVQFSSYCIQWHFKIPTHYWLIETLRWNQPYIFLYVSPIIILLVVLSTRSHRLWVPLLLEIWFAVHLGQRAW